METGFDNWKKAFENFNLHAQSDLHKETLLKMEFLNQEGVHVLLHQQIRSEQEVRKKMLIKQLNSLRYLFRQGMTIRGHDEL